MVGVVVGLEHVLDVDRAVASQLEVLVDLKPRIDHRRDPGALIADQIGGTAEVIVGDLFEEHRSPFQAAGTSCARHSAPDRQAEEILARAPRSAGSDDPLNVLLDDVPELVQPPQPR